MVYSTTKRQCFVMVLAFVLFRFCFALALLRRENCSIYFGLGLSTIFGQCFARIPAAPIESFLKQEYSAHKVIHHTHIAHDLFIHHQPKLSLDYSHHCCTEAKKLPCYPQRVAQLGMPNGNQRGPFKNQRSMSRALTAVDRTAFPRNPPRNAVGPNVRPDFQPHKRRRLGRLLANANSWSQRMALTLRAWQQPPNHNKEQLHNSSNTTDSIFNSNRPPQALALFHPKLWPK